MDYLEITAKRDEDFHFALHTPELSKLVDLSAGQIRVQLRRTPESTLCNAELLTDRDVFDLPFGGNVWWDPDFKVLSVFMLHANVLQLGLSGRFFIRGRLEMLGFTYDIFDGVVDFEPDIVRTDGTIRHPII